MTDETRPPSQPCDHPRTVPRLPCPVCMAHPQPLATCTETVEGLFDRWMICGEQPGHPLPHVDPTDGCRWAPRGDDQPGHRSTGGAG